MKVFRVLKKNVYGVSQKEVSELAAFKQMDEYRADFRIAIKSGFVEEWRRLIYFLFGLIRNSAIKKKRPQKTPPLYNANFKLITN